MRNLIFDIFIIFLFFYCILMFLKLFCFYACFLFLIGSECESFISYYRSYYLREWNSKSNWTRLHSLVGIYVDYDASWKTWP